MHLPIVCFDMDGTLLDAHGNIHPEDAALLASADPRALFIPSTGRPTASVRCAFARNGLYLDRPLPFNMVLQNGALLLARHEVPLAYDRLEANIQQRLIALAGGFPQVTFLFLSASDIYVLWPSPFGLALAGSFDFAVRPLSEAGADTPFSKVMCMSDSPAALRELARLVESWPIESALSMPTILEITNYDVNKGRGVQKLLREIGREGCPVYAAGDWANDLPLFRVAAASFAPATAPESIRAAASHVIDVSRHGLLAPMLEIAG